MLVIGDFASSLKFLYDAESLIMECRQNTKLTKDLVFAHSAISALAFFRNRKFDSAESTLKLLLTSLIKLLEAIGKAGFLLTLARIFIVLLACF